MDMRIGKNIVKEACKQSMSVDKSRQKQNMPRNRGGKAMNGKWTKEKVDCR